MRRSVGNDEIGGYLVQLSEYSWWTLIVFGLLLFWLAVAWFVSALRRGGLPRRAFSLVERRRRRMDR
jgi:hypothetical protein